MKRHFSYAELASIEATQARQTERNQSQSKSHSRQRIRIHIKKIEAVTSSDRNTAFWMNEYNIVHHIDTKAQPKKAYYKFFGQYVEIKDGELQEFIQREIEIFWF